MDKQTYRFTASSTDVYYGAGFRRLNSLVKVARAVLITDEHVYRYHKAKFRGWNTIILKPGEAHKVQSTVDAIIDQLLEMEAGRDTTIIGVGGGVVTDITGFVASIFKRGVPFGFVPTTLLGLVDASLGGKNGIDVGPYKNMVGTIRQPLFILHDLSFLQSLPDNEWRNGFAEIIKHASIADLKMFRQLEGTSIVHFQKDRSLLSLLVRRNADLKLRLVKKDEFEKGPRMALNFGHTIGHALENQYELSHGEAIAIGMAFAANLSARLIGFKGSGRVIKLLERYGLPTYARYNKKKVINVLRADKKRQNKEINFILLESVGKAVISKIPVAALERNILSIG
jgi:3-dehydroquinate synthase